LLSVNPDPREIQQNYSSGKVEFSFKDRLFQSYSFAGFRVDQDLPNFVSQFKDALRPDSDPSIDSISWCGHFAGPNNGRISS
jgi:hypothetical protein